MAEISRVKLYDYISYLNDSQMLLLVDEKTKGLKKLSKPAKIYLNNTGTLREVFVASIVSQSHTIQAAKKVIYL